jgi:hypothetical protein
MITTQKERKIISSAQKLNITGLDKHLGTCTSLLKQLGLSLSALNMIVKTVMSKKMQISKKNITLFFEDINTLFMLRKNFHSYLTNDLTCIMILYIFNFWKLYIVKCSYIA